MNRGNEDAQRGEIGGGGNFDFPVSTNAHRFADESHSVNCEDKVVQRGEGSSMSFLRGSWNVKIDIDNLMIIRFGNDRITKDQRNLICDLIANHANLPDINHNLNRHILPELIMNLPRAEAVFETKNKSGPCFEGTRVALLREMANWATSPDESGMYVLSGLAGIGKSTVAYTIASRSANLNLLGASFFFSRDESGRKNAKKFFTTIAYQLCVYNETFAKAIGDVLQPYHGSAAITGGPREQLQTLIVGPLKGIHVQYRARPILVVVDALDECDEQDVLSVLAGLRQLVRVLPSFKVILTTRPQPRLDPFLVNRNVRLRDIEDTVVGGDIRLYLNQSLSLEKVQEHFPTCQWCVSDKEVDALVRAAGRHFVIASTVVRIILDKVASNPIVQMKKLLSTFGQDHMPFKDLNEFYTVILRHVVPAVCDVNIVNRYQSIVGAIIFVQRPLHITALAHLIDIDMEEIRAVLVNLRSVILLGDDDIPRMYHKSFRDYITDQALCKDPPLQIDTRIHHTQIVTRCFDIMDKHLQRNILGLGEPAQFMSNEDGIKADGITDEQIQEKIPQQLHYACAYWANHLKVAKMEDEGLMNGLERFAHKHMLYWLEVLSLIGQMDLAYCAIGVVVRLLTLTSSDLHRLLSDALRFISRFYEIIKRSALHTYYSALPFTPTNSLLYHQYIKEAEHNICSVEGMPEKWDALVANMRPGKSVEVIKFSLDSTLLVSCAGLNYESEQGELMIWDVATGTPISTIPGDRFAVANDFSTVASSLENIAMLYNMNGSPSGTMFTTSSKICKLALSSENSRIAAALDGGTVWLWDSESAELVDRFDGFGARSDRDLQLEFSCTGTRLAYSSPNGIKLRDGIGGGFIADLQCGSRGKFQFSGDGSRIASLIYSHDFWTGTLWMWGSESGEIIAAFSDVRWSSIAISANGSLLATAYRRLGGHYEVAVWKENSDSLDQIMVLEVILLYSMAFSLDNILAIATSSDIKLYSVNSTCSFIHTLPFSGSHLPPVFSPNCTRLAVGDHFVQLFDIRTIDASGTQTSERGATAVTALTLSRDCSRLACGFKDGTIKLWGTSPTNFTNKRFGTLALRSEMEKFYIRIFCQSRYMRQSVLTLGFDPNGSLLASGWDDGTIELWDDGGDGVLCVEIE